MSIPIYITVSQCVNELIFVAYQSSAPGNGNPQSYQILHVLNASKTTPTGLGFTLNIYNNTQYIYPKSITLGYNSSGNALTTNPNPNSNSTYNISLPAGTYNISLIGINYGNGNPCFSGNINGQQQINFNNSNISLLPTNNGVINVNGVLYTLNEPVQIVIPIS